VTVYLAGRCKKLLEKAAVSRAFWRGEFYTSISQLRVKEGRCWMGEKANTSLRDRDAKCGGSPTRITPQFCKEGKEGSLNQHHITQ